MAEHNLPSHAVKPELFILATCRNPDLLDASLLVFNTVRVGFPNAEISVVINGGSHCSKEIQRAAEDQASAENVVNLSAPVIHHEWIQDLIFNRERPFWICDTDVIFFNKMDDLRFGYYPMAGRFVPEFFEKWGQCVNHARLHTALMWLDPVEIRRKTREFHASFHHGNPFKYERNMVYPFYYILNGGRFFHDTMGLLYQAIDGSRFLPGTLDCFSHLGCGTYSDIVGPSYGVPMSQRNSMMMRTPAMTRHLWRQQDKFYERQKP